MSASATDSGGTDDNSTKNIREVIASELKDHADKITTELLSKITTELEAKIALEMGKKAADLEVKMTELFSKTAASGDDTSPDVLKAALQREPVIRDVPDYCGPRSGLLTPDGLGTNANTSACLHKFLIDERFTVYDNIDGSYYHDISVIHQTPNVHLQLLGHVSSSRRYLQLVRKCRPERNTGSDILWRHELDFIDMQCGSNCDEITVRSKYDYHYPVRSSLIFSDAKSALQKCTERTKEGTRLLEYVTNEPGPDACTVIEEWKNVMLQESHESYDSLVQSLRLVHLPAEPTLTLVGAFKPDDETLKPRCHMRLTPSVKVRYRDGEPMVFGPCPDSSPAGTMTYWKVNIVAGGLELMKALQMWQSCQQ